jgi:hypothetical protein
MQKPLFRLSVASLLAAVALLGMNCPGALGLRVGVCQRDITPISPSLADEYQAAFGHAGTVNHTDPVFMAGFGNDRRATGYHDRQWARGVVVEGFGGRIAIVTLDLVGYFNNEIQTIRGLVDPRSAVDYVVVSSTHNHEGPDTLGIWGPDSLTTGIDFGYLDFVNEQVADCIDDAAAHMQLARVKFGTATSSGLSLGTDAEDDGLGVGDGKVLEGDLSLSPLTEGRFVDPRLAVMQFSKRGPPFKTIATLVNFASHPESMGSNNTQLTSDFPHFARERIEDEEGGMAIWVSGDLGVLQGPLDIDVQDPATGLPAPRRTFRWAQVHGEQLADRALTSLSPHPGNPIGVLAFKSKAPVAVPLDNPFFRLFIAIGVIDPRRQLFTNGAPDPSVGFPFPPPFDVIPQALGADLHTEVGAFRINEGSFAVLPSELDPQIGESYRSQMIGARHTFLIGLGNDEIGYQVPFAKWDDSCHTCAPFIIAGVPEFCPLFPDIDCNTVFENNVGQQVDPSISAALEPLIDQLH